MLVRDIMTKDVVTVPPSVSVADAQKIMRERNFRRLPVVDVNKLVGIVTEDRLGRVSPRTTSPFLWQIAYLVSHTTVGEVMSKKVVTVKPEATVEQAVALAQSRKVGSLVVVEGGKVVGIVTTNDFFYSVVNPILGLGESGVRIIVPEGGGGQSAERIIACINKLGVGIRILWTIASSVANKKDIVIQLDTEDATIVIKELQNLGFSASIRPS